jgi:hypothetical protein
VWELVRDNVRVSESAWELVRDSVGVSERQRGS